MLVTMAWVPHVRWLACGLAIGEAIRGNRPVHRAVGLGIGEALSWTRLVEAVGGAE